MSNARVGRALCTSLSLCLLLASVTACSGLKAKAGCGPLKVSRRAAGDYEVTYQSRDGFSFYEAILAPGSNITPWIWLVHDTRLHQFSKIRVGTAPTGFATITRLQSWSGLKSATVEIAGQDARGEEKTLFCTFKVRQ